MAANRDALPAGLLADVENYLQIPAADEVIDQRISGLIAAGMRYLDGKLGIRADYTEDGDARTLLMEYVRYARDGAMDVFEANYTHLILAAQNAIKIEVIPDAPCQSV